MTFTQVVENSESQSEKAQQSVKVAKKPQLSKLCTISLAHMLNDWYMNYVQTLLPFLVAAGLSISKGAFLVSTFTITSSILQPVFGYLVDKKNQRWMVYAGTIWMAVLLCVLGLIHDYALMFVAVMLSGLGTAAFHPQASAMVSSVSGERKGFFQAIFVTAGNIGWAFTPLIIVPFVQNIGLKATPIFVLPGIAVGILLWITSPKMPSKKMAVDSSVFDVFKKNWKVLSRIIFVVAFRSLAYFGIVSFLPLYLKSKGVSVLTSSHLLFLMLFCGALGGLVGGYLSDKIGRKAVIVASLALATPFFYMFLSTTGIASYICMSLAGACLLASFSVTVVLAQEILSKNQAMASGLMLGFSIGIGGLGVGLVGIVAEKIGLQFAINLLVFLPLVAGLLGLFITEKKSVLS